MVLRRSRFVGVLLVLFLLLPGVRGAKACTEVYIGERNVSARNFDFFLGDGVVSLFPRGMVRHSSHAEEGEEPLVWISRYGSLSFEVRFPGVDGGEPVMADIDGMNEKGLKGGTYVLRSTEFLRTRGLPNLDIGSLLQYFLDNFATVDEALEDLASSRYRVVALPIGEVPIKLHLFLQDATGESAIVEFLKGEVVVHRNPEMPILTNTAYDEAMSALAGYREFGGEKEIPGANESLDRFVRGAFYLRHLPEPSDADEAVRWGFATIQTLSVPPLFPHGCTQWTIVSDIESRRVFFRTLDNPSVSFIDLKDVDFSVGQPVKTLDFRQKDLSGNVTDRFVF